MRLPHVHFVLDAAVFLVQFRIMFFVAEEEHEYQADGSGKYNEDCCPGCKASAFIIKPADCELADALDCKGKYGTETVQAAALA